MLKRVRVTAPQRAVPVFIDSPFIKFSIKLEKLPYTYINYRELDKTV